MNEPRSTSQNKKPKQEKKTLSFNTPELRKLLHDTIQQNEDDASKWSHGRFDIHPYSIFLTNHGYMQGPAPAPTALLNNKIHPIFSRENWHGPFDFAAFFEAAKPALQLASLWLSHDSWVLDWWVHLYYGRAQIDSQRRMYLADDPCEAHTYCRAVMRTKMEDLAGRIQFVFLPPAIVRDALGSCTRTTKLFATLLVQQATFPTVSLSFFDAFTDAGGPVLALSSEFYHIALAGMSNRSISGAQRLQHHFQLAHTIIHELAHALMAIWHPWTSFLIEPLHSPRDLFPESGKSWEFFLFGADVTTAHSSSPLMCKEWHHSMPSASSKSSGETLLLPLATFIPESWTNRWFLKSTWTNIATLRAALAAPSVQKDASVIAVSQFRDGQQKLAVYHNGREVSRDAQVFSYIYEYLGWDLESPNDDDDDNVDNDQRESANMTPFISDPSLSMTTILKSPYYTSILHTMHSQNLNPQYIHMHAPHPSTLPPCPLRLTAYYTELWTRESTLPCTQPSLHPSNQSTTQVTSSSPSHAPHTPPISVSQPPPQPSYTTTDPLSSHPYTHLTLPRCGCEGCAGVLRGMICAERGVASREVRGALERMEVRVQEGGLVFWGWGGGWRVRG